MKLTFAILEKYRDIIDFTAYPERACPLREFRWCESCEFYKYVGGCVIDIHAKCNQSVLSAFRQKYPELFV